MLLEIKYQNNSFYILISYAYELGNMKPAYLKQLSNYNLAQI